MLEGFIKKKSLPTSPPPSRKKQKMKQGQTTPKRVRGA